MNVKCLCGVELVVSEASSGMTVLVEPHACLPPALDVSDVSWSPAGENVTWATEIDRENPDE